MKYDFIILGQGIAGSFLSFYLRSQGKKILVIDEGNDFTASKVASGVINPVTGKRIVQTWLADQLLPFASEAYQDIGKAINANVIRKLSILSFHKSMEERTIFADRAVQDNQYLSELMPEGDWNDVFRFNYGAGIIGSSLLIDLKTVLGKWRTLLKRENALLEETFNWDGLSVSSDQVSYGDIKAEKIICCEGVKGFDNPYFKMLPWSVNKGEALIVRIPGLPSDLIFKQGISIVPWKGDLFWVGASYDWSYENMLPSADFRRRVEEQLNYWLKLPYEIIDHFASARPASVGQKPFVGFHPVFPSVGILNGMGSKGCSLAPYFSRQLTEGIIDPQADVRRFSGVLSRSTY